VRSEAVLVRIGSAACDARTHGIGQYQGVLDRQAGCHNAHVLCIEPDHEVIGPHRRYQDVGHLAYRAVRGLLAADGD